MRGVQSGTPLEIVQSYCSNMEKQIRGFASMDQAKQRVIASKGGRTAHEKGTAHKWTVEEARAAGRKGGAASRRHAEERSPGVVEG